MPPNPRVLHFGADARTRLAQGALKLTKAVAATYGPQGRIVALDRAQGLLHTKDGVTVAREVSLRDPVENLGADLVKGACIAVNDSVGDGTTSTAIMTQHLISQGLAFITAGYDPKGITTGFRDAAALACGVIADMAVSVDSEEVLRHVARVASNDDDELAKALAEAAFAVGKDGVVQIEDGHKVEVETEYKDGMEIPKGWLSAYLVNHVESQSIRLKDVLATVVTTPLTTVADVVSIMEEASTFRVERTGARDPLVIFAPYIEGAALQTLLMNAHVCSRSIGKYPSYIPLCAPGTRAQKREILGDLAALTGAVLVDPAAGMDLHKFERGWFGSLQEISVTRDKSLLIPYEETLDRIAQRLKVLRALEYVATSDHDKDRLKQRMAHLSGGVCILRVGGVTEAAMKERRGRMEDALASVRSALQTGVVPGGGVSYLAAHEECRQVGNTIEDPDELQGWRIFTDALLQPLRTLAQVAGHEAPLCKVDEVLKARKEDPYGWVGWDARADTIRPFNEGALVLDPAGVLVAVVEASCSVASTLLTVEATITMKRSK